MGFRTYGTLVEMQSYIMFLIFEPVSTGFTFVLSSIPLVISVSLVVLITLVTTTSLIIPSSGVPW